MKPDLSTYGGFKHDLGYQGGLVDLNDYAAQNMVNDQATVIDFGVFVSRSGAALSTDGSGIGRCKAVSANADIIVGISIKFPATQVSNSGVNGGSIGFNQYDAVPTLRRGWIYVIAAENVTQGDQACAIVALAGQAGSVRNTPIGTATAAPIGTTARASGTITFGANAAPGDTVTINGTVVTFVAANPEGNQVAIGISANATAAALQTFLAESEDANISQASYSVATDVVTITFLIGGTLGNAFTLAASAATVSGANLTGGTGNTGNGTIALAGEPVLPTAKNGLYIIRFTAATVFSVYDPAGNLVSTTGATGTAFSDQIAFTITAGGTAFVAGDQIGVTVTLGSASGRIPVKGATWETTTTAGQIGVISANINN